MTRCAILSRVSTERQAAEGQASLENQEDTLRRVAERNGWEIVRVFAIPGESAFVGDIASRPQFEEAIRAAKNREFDILLVRDFSRFARNKRLAENVLEELRTARVALIDAAGINYTRNEDMATFASWAAYRASADQGLRVRRGHEAIFRRGLPVGDIPFGYRRQMMEDGKGVRLPNTGVPPVVVPEEAEGIRFAFHSYARGGTLRSIADELNGRGLQPRSKIGRTRFEESSIQSLLETRFYTGTVSMRVTHEDEFGRERRLETLPGLHEAVISEDEWLAAEARRQQGSRPRRPGNPGGQLLSGIAECYHCASRLRVNDSATGRYVCRPVQRQVCRVAGKTILGSRIHPVVEGLMESLTKDVDFLTEVRRGPSAPRARKSTAAKERARLEERRKRIVGAYTSGWMTAVEADAEMREVQREMAGLGEDIEQLQSAAVALDGLRDLWAIASPERRNEALRELLEGVAVDIETHAVLFRPRSAYEDLFSARRTWVREGAIWRVYPRQGSNRSSPDGLWTPAELGVAA